MTNVRVSAGNAGGTGESTDLNGIGGEAQIQDGFWACRGPARRVRRRGRVGVRKVDIRQAFVAPSVCQIRQARFSRLEWENRRLGRGQEREARRTEVRAMVSVGPPFSWRRGGQPGVAADRIAELVQERAVPDEVVPTRHGGEERSGLENVASEGTVGQDAGRSAPVMNPSIPRRTGQRRPLDSLLVCELPLGTRGDVSVVCRVVVGVCCDPGREHDCPSGQPHLAVGCYDVACGQEGSMLQLPHIIVRIERLPDCLTGDPPAVRERPFDSTFYITLTKLSRSSYKRLNPPRAPFGSSEPRNPRVEQSVAPREDGSATGPARPLPSQTVRARRNPAPTKESFRCNYVA